LREEGLILAKNISSDWRVKIDDSNELRSFLIKAETERRGRFFKEKIDLVDV
jgi:hypothetical protein